MIRSHLRTVAFLLLAAVTVWLAVRFLGSDWHTVLDAWRRRGDVVLFVLGLSLAETLLEMVCWIWVYTRLGVRTADRTGAIVFFTYYAGLILPAQLGRLIRPDALYRMGRAPLARTAMAEVVSFYLDAVSLGVTLAAVACWLLWPWGTILAGVATAIVLLVVAGKATALLAGSPLALPAGFWWHYSTVAVIVLRVVGWSMLGLCLYLLTCGLPGDISPARAIFFTSVSAVVGTGSGLPGGLGATEGTLGVLLSLARLPEAHLAVAVGIFRAITYWIHIPIGWCALLWFSRRIAPLNAQTIARDQEDLKAQR